MSDTDIKCPHCGATVLKHVAYRGRFYATHKCRRCGQIFKINLKQQEKE